MQGNKQKIGWLALLQYSLYCSGLKPNPQYIPGLTVLPPSDCRLHAVRDCVWNSQCLIEYVTHNICSINTLYVLNILSVGFLKQNLQYLYLKVYPATKNHSKSPLSGCMCINYNTNSMQLKNKSRNNFLLSVKVSNKYFTQCFVFEI